MHGSVGSPPEPTSLTRLSERFQYYSTPEKDLHLPEQLRKENTIDFEMDTSVEREPEVMRVTAQGYFTSEMLVDSLVWLDVPKAHYNTGRSGGDTSSDIRSLSK